MTDWVVHRRFHYCQTDRTCNPYRIVTIRRTGRVSYNTPSATNRRVVVCIPVQSLASYSHLRRYGSPYIELCESSYIIGGGFISLVEYKGKGYFSGRSHSFKATVSPQPGMNSGTGAGEHVIEGTWHVNSKFTKGGHNNNLFRNGGLFHDVETVPKEEVTAVGGDGLGEMGEFETRQLWKLVAQGIREGDFETASREKTRIEVGVTVFLSSLAR